MRRLDGRVAVVTGGSSGIGRAIARRFAAEGARVVIGDINLEGGRSVVRQIEQAGGEAMVVGTDVARSAEVTELFRQAVARFKTVDILVNNAGIGELSPNLREQMESRMSEMVSGGVQSSLSITRNMSDEEWCRMLEVHLFGTFYCTREALKIMEPKRKGAIVNIASVAGISGFPGAPHYGAAKAGIIGFTKSVALEVGRSGLRVNAIAPGFIDTPMTEPLPEPIKQMAIFRTPLGRIGLPQEIAAVALFLAGDDASFVTGQVVSPNGGLLT